jgi:glycerol uptake facilitator-like aquaporin
LHHGIIQIGVAIAVIIIHLHEQKCQASASNEADDDAQSAAARFAASFAARGHSQSIAAGWAYNAPTMTDGVAVIELRNRYRLIAEVAEV